MYIGPWQEFKLARILQLKEKVQREEEEELLKALETLNISEVRRGKSL